MVRVIEDPSGQALNTDYVFDTLGNLRKTIQGEQSRYFMHDSLGRLLYAKQPEQDTRGAFVATDPVTGNTAWSAKYEHDDNGNITKTTDAKGVYVEGTYDNLNRIKLRNYSDTTPDVEFYYDGKYIAYINGADVPQTATGSVKGKTTGVKSAVSRTNYTSFDDLGRLSTHQQITDGQTYATSYTYNLSGGLISETYPSGRTVNYDINADGDVSRIWGTVGSQNRLYVNAIHYNSQGGMDRLRLGNGKWESAKYNERLQITQIGLGAGSNDTSVLKLEYGYGDNTLNNGNLRSQKISFNGLAQPFEQTYTYDDLNRLQVAEEKVSGSTTWKQTFTIDRYGNRRFDAANTTTLGSCSQAQCNPLINTTDNRFSTGQGYVYDSNGSVTQDASGQRFGYDAENHQKEFFVAGNSSTNPDATYSYDGDGRRVKKISATETTVFVYNASGQLVAEYSTQIAQTPQVSYLTTDHLGSPRVITNEAGVVKDRKDFSAFGEETVSAQRSTNTEYNAADQLRKNYTGYEKDSESGLEFAQARYYNPTHGRFTSVDPLTASASIKNPQTFNRYSYVLNSPYKYTDPLGLISETTGANGGRAWCATCQSTDDDTPWFADPTPPEQQPANVGVAGAHEAAQSADQPEAAEPEPPTPPTAEQNAEPPPAPDRNSTLRTINGMNSTERAALEMILGEALSTNQVGQPEYAKSQNTSGRLVSAPSPTGETITTGDIQTSMFMFLLVMENRAANGGFGGNSVESVMTDGQVARSRGQAILQAFIDNRTRSDGLGGLGDVELAVGTVRRWSAGGLDNGVNNIRYDLQQRGVADKNVLYWKAVIQPPGISLRSWRQGVDVVRVGRTDFAYNN